MEKYILEVLFVGFNPYTHHRFHKTVTRCFQSMEKLEQWLADNKVLEYWHANGVSSTMKYDSHKIIKCLY